MYQVSSWSGNGQAPPILWHLRVMTRIGPLLESRSYTPHGKEADA